MLHVLPHVDSSFMAVSAFDVDDGNTCDGNDADYRPFGALLRSPWVTWRAPEAPPFVAIFSLKTTVLEISGRKIAIARTSGGTCFYPGGCPCKTPDCPMSAPWRLQTRPAPHIRCIILRRNSAAIVGSRRRRRPCRRIPSPAGFEASREGAMRAPERLWYAPLCKGPRRMKSQN